MIFPSTIKEINSGLKEKKFSAKELTENFFKKIDEKEKNISSFLFPTKNIAQKQAEEVDYLLSQKEKISFLAGIPMAVKDNILLNGFRCTAASKILSDYFSPYDATVIKKIKNEKSVILGKTNLDEFAMGSSTENSFFGPSKNPHDNQRVPGGSSGGSAAAVSSGECVYALGSDTGGSIRLPASFCGVVGLKPTYGTISRYGLIPFASSLDQIGPITKTVEDAEIVFNSIKGNDHLDSTSVIYKENPSKKIENLRIGIPKEYFVDGIDVEVKKVIESVIGKLKNVENLSLPSTKSALASYYIIASSEASANLARYDGIKYGFSDKESKDLIDNYLNTRDNGFGKEVKKRIMLGTYSLSSGYYDKYYLKAQKARDLIKKDFQKIFEKVDLILSPVSPCVAFKIGEKINNPLSMYLTDVYTTPTSLAGLPAMSIPCGMVDGLPVGLQIIGKHFHEEDIFQIGKHIEKIVNFS